MNTVKRSRIYNWVLFAAFAGLSVVLMFTHEPWRDEAQQWLYVKNQSFLSMLSNLHFEGHPALWYLLIWPLAKLNCGYFSVSVLHLAFVLLCGGLLVFRSPFRFHLKVLFLFSAALGYYYNAVARSYILMAVLLFMIAMVFPQRHGRYKYVYGLLLLLINTHLYAAIGAVVIVFYDLLTLHPNRKITPAYLKSRDVTGFLVSVAFCAAGFILFYLALHGERDYYGGTAGKLSTYLLADYFQLGLNITKMGFGGNLINQFLYYFGNIQMHPLRYECVMFFGNVAVIILVLMALLYKFKAALLTLLYTALLAVCAAAGAPLNYWNAAVVFVIYIFAMWISAETPDELSDFDAKWNALVNKFTFKKVNFLYLAVILLLLTNTYAMYLSAYTDIRYPYTNAAEAAKFIEAKGYDTAGACIVTHDVAQTDAILPYMHNIRYLSLPGWSDQISYCPWDNNYLSYNPTNQTIFSYARQKYSATGKAPLVIYDTSAADVPDDFVCIYSGQSHAVIGDEQFSIYTLREAVK